MSVNKTNYNSVCYIFKHYRNTYVHNTYWRGNDGGSNQQTDSEMYNFCFKL